MAQNRSNEIKNDNRLQIQHNIFDCHGTTCAVSFLAIESILQKITHGNEEKLIVITGKDLHSKSKESFEPQERLRSYIESQ